MAYGMMPGMMPGMMQYPGMQQPQQMTGNPYLDRLMSMQVQPPQPAAQPQVQPCQVASVNGKSGADAYWLPANSSILLLDEEQPIVWLKRTDEAGRPTSTPYRIAPMEDAPAQPDYNALESRVKRLEEMLNGKPDDVPARQTRRNKAHDAADVAE